MSGAAAILWAQWRCLWNHYRRGSRARHVLTAGLSALWYGGWAAGAVFVGLFLAGAEDGGVLAHAVPRGLLFAFLYWQLIPILVVAPGAALDLKRLLVYPIPRGSLFRLEALLRLTAAGEMLLVLAAASAGLVANPHAPAWTPLALAVFAAMNLLLAAGIKNLLARLLARRHVREALFLLVVLAAGLPQVVVLWGAPNLLRAWLGTEPGPWWPWTVASQAALGGGARPWLTLLGWTAAAWAFGRWQFGRSLRFDEAEAGARTAGIAGREGWWRRVARLPSLMLPDPVGALVEKELLFLSRSARFRLVFVMGFSFGLLVWLPLLLGGAGDGDSPLASDYLTFVSAYALLLLGEVTFWNSFGLDRTGAQFYFVTPVPAGAVIRGKNVAAVLAVLAEVTLVALVCSLLRMPVSVRKLVEAYGVALVLAQYLLAAGNLGSVYHPRPADPQAPWRSGSGGRFQAMLLLLYPVLALPVISAFVVRWALGSEAAFYGMLALAAVFGAVLYRRSAAWAAARLEARRENVLVALREGAGPVLA